MTDLVKLKPRVKLFVTPKLLREWADLCERKWKNATAGQSVVFHELDYYPDVDFALAWDQEEMHKLDRLGR